MRPCFERRSEAQVASLYCETNYRLRVEWPSRTRQCDNGGRCCSRGAQCEQTTKERRSHYIGYRRCPYRRACDRRPTFYSAGMAELVTRISGRAPQERMKGMRTYQSTTGLLAVSASEEMDGPSCPRAGAVFFLHHMRKTTLEKPKQLDPTGREHQQKRSRHRSALSRYHGDISCLGR
jgi:hypothetical protein